jgi:hypothetical protein
MRGIQNSQVNQLNVEQESMIGVEPPHLHIKHQETVSINTYKIHHASSESVDPKTSH